MNEMT